jgi:inorganic pyrophosphatase
VFKLKKTLPLGSSFPFDFGFIPNTQAEDGDPIDVLVVMDEPAYPGSLVTCRLIGVLEAKQKERNGAEGRNDRIVAVAEKSVLYGEIKNLRDLSQSMEDQISQLFCKLQRAGRQSIYAAALVRCGRCYGIDQTGNEGVKHRFSGSTRKGLMSVWVLEKLGLANLQRTIKDSLFQAFSNADVVTSHSLRPLF